MKRSRKDATLNSEAQKKYVADFRKALAVEMKKRKTALAAELKKRKATCSSPQRSTTMEKQSHTEAEALRDVGKRRGSDHNPIAVIGPGPYVEFNGEGHRLFPGDTLRAFWTDQGKFCVELVQTKRVVEPTA